MLKLAKIPDRTPIRITITASAALNRDLQDYAALYRTAYGEDVSVADLIPFMLDSFLKSDPAFAKARRVGVQKTGIAIPADVARVTVSSKQSRETVKDNVHTQPEQED